MLHFFQEIHIDDYDFDGNMLWCRYRRLIGNSLNSVVNPTRGFYTLLYRGEINPHGYPSKYIARFLVCS